MRDKIDPRVTPRPVAGRGYGLGERNPSTMVGESDEENRRNTQRWKLVRRWAEEKGGRY